MTTPKILALLKISARVGPEELRAASAELRATGVDLCAEELQDALRQVRAYRNSLTGEWVVPDATPPQWAYDDVQDVLRKKANLRGEALFAAWQKVKGHIRLRVANGNMKRPADHLIIKWVTVSSQQS